MMRPGYYGSISLNKHPLFEVRAINWNNQKSIDRTCCEHSHDAVLCIGNPGSVKIIHGISDQVGLGTQK